MSPGLSFRCYSRHLMRVHEQEKSSPLNTTSRQNFPQGIVSSLNVQLPSKEMCISRIKIGTGVVCSVCSRSPLLHSLYLCLASVHGGHFSRSYYRSVQFFSYLSPPFSRDTRQHFSR